MRRVDPDHEALLDAVFEDAEVKPIRERSLEHLLRAADRRRRQRATVSRIGLAAALVVVLIAGAFRFLTVPRQAATAVAAKREPRERNAATEPPRVATPPERSLNVLTDTELLEFFPGHPAALIGEPGHQRLVFLERSIPVEVL